MMGDINREAKNHPIRSRVNRVYEKLSSIERPMLIMAEEDDLVCIKSGTVSFDRILNSPTSRKKVVGVYDWTIDLRDLENDIREHLQENGIVYG
jgi:hypothetical protein